MSEHESLLQIYPMLDQALGVDSILALVAAWKYKQLKGRKQLDQPIAIFETEVTKEDVRRYLMNQYQEQLEAMNGEVDNLVIGIGEGEHRIEYTSQDYQR